MVKDFEKEDPFEMMAMEIPGDKIVQQAQVMAEEFRDMGMDQDELLSMFTDPFYGGMYMAYSQLGKNTIAQIVGSVYEKIHVIDGQEF